jgi:hypothetical protein
MDVKLVMWEVRNSSGLSVAKPQFQAALGTTRHSLHDNIKMNLTRISCALAVLYKRHLEPVHVSGERSYSRRNFCC